MDWEALMAKIDAKMDSMQGTIDSTNEYSQEMMHELTKHKKVHLDLVRTVKSECATL